MSRDRRDANGPDRDAESSSTLLAAYVDGVAELSLEERREVEARLAGDPEARAEQAAVRELLGQLRELPPEGVEPDWAEMARSIRDRVGDDVPRPWWRRWRWLVPLTTCATAAAVLIAIGLRPTRDHSAPADTTASVPSPPASAPSPPSEEPAGNDTVALWLDGREVDVDPSAADLLAGPELGLYEPALSGGDPDGDIGGEPAGEPAGDIGGEIDDVGLLPATNLAWVDNLDDDAIDRAERWLGSTDPASLGRTKG